MKELHFEGRGGAYGLSEKDNITTTTTTSDVAVADPFKEAGAADSFKDATSDSFQDTVPPLLKDPATLSLGLVLPADTEEHEPDFFPEGGFWGWATVAGAFLIQFCGFGYTDAFGVYQDYYGRIYMPNVNASAISWIGSVNATLATVTGLVIGRLYDRGYFLHILYAGALLSSFSLFMLSLTQPHHYYQAFLTQGIGLGLGTGLLYVPSMAVISHYFDRRLALAMSVASSGISLGAVVHPIMLNNLLNIHPRGGGEGEERMRRQFGNATRASAGLVVGCLGLACLLMRPRLSVVGVRKGGQKKAGGEGEWRMFTTKIRKFSKDGAYVAATLGLTIFSLGFYFPIFYLQLNAITHGLNKTFAFYALVIMNFSTFCSRLTCGFFARRLGVENLIAGAAFTCSIMIFAMMKLDSVASVVVVAVLYGVFSGPFVGLITTLMTILADDIDEVGVRIGVAFAFAGFGDLIGTPITGALLTRDYIWWRGTLFNGIVAILGGSCYVVMLIILHRRRKAKAAALAVGVEVGQVMPEKA
ncbi:major facilitator superfamily domain-containing protein [Crucibulum laeve]|uniref:Major facilitator superfamily domain-containing protein n=1 Tax=Crucibulum laeve TaxID=68775 RepID=A0A5C3MI34_9AGAR|nr:major facilitator superfamily domain-containing protein [Crucibulum laeve]